MFFIANKIVNVRIFTRDRVSLPYKIKLNPPPFLPNYKNFIPNFMLRYPCHPSKTTEMHERKTIKRMKYLENKWDKADSSLDFIRLSTLHIPINLTVEEFQNIRSEKDHNSMMHALVYSSSSQNVSGIIPLNNYVFSTQIRPTIVHEVIVWQRACRRKGWALCRSRAEVKGSRRKVRPQKGTGKARQGDRYAPHWKGGGKAHGPHPKDYTYNLPQRIIRNALRICLTARYNENDLIILDNLKFGTDNQSINDFVEKLNLTNAVIVDTTVDPTLVDGLSKVNSFITLKDCYNLDVESIVNKKQLVLTLSALEQLELFLEHDGVYVNDPNYYELKYHNRRMALELFQNIIKAKKRPIRRYLLRKVHGRRIYTKFYKLKHYTLPSSIIRKLKADKRNTVINQPFLQNYLHPFQKDNGQITKSDPIISGKLISSNTDALIINDVKN